MEKPLLVTFLGYPGSGKTHLSRQLAERLPAITLNGDALKLSMFGTREEILRARASDSVAFQREVFGAMDYAARQVLSAGYSVIYDAQQNKYENREHVRNLAEEVGATAVLAWIKTSPETALLRGQERESGDDSLRHSAKKMAALLKRFHDITELPEPNENVIEISGEVPFEEQYEVFQKGVKELL